MHSSNWSDRETPRDLIEELPYPRAKSARQVPQATRARIARAVPLAERKSDLAA